jgi:hypothetical protein
MRKQEKRLGLCGNSRPFLDLMSDHLREIRAGAGASITPSGAPVSLVAPSPSGKNG